MVLANGLRGTAGGVIEVGPDGAPDVEKDNKRQQIKPFIQVCFRIKVY